MNSQPSQSPLLEVASMPPSRVCGLDEVGRGALAGPLVAAAVVLPDDFDQRLGLHMRFLRDSKTVPRHHRQELAHLIHAHALFVEITEISVAAINEHGIGWANREAFFRLIERIEADEYIVDGRVRPHAPAERAGRVRCMIKADAHVPAVSAASIIAKVYRDAVMAATHEAHPAFHWNENAGYGTPMHIAALFEHGPCVEHRMAFVNTVLAGGQRARRSSSEDREHAEQRSVLLPEWSAE